MEFKIGISSDQIAAITELKQKFDGDLAAINEYKFAEREKVEAIILEKAVKQAGLKATFKYVPFKDSASSLQALIKGEIDGIGYSIPLKQLAKEWSHIYITTAMVSRGDNVYGVYGLKTNPKFVAAKTEEDVRNLVGMTSELWTGDWATMKGVGVRDRRNGGWPEQVKGIVSGEVDFIFRGFGNEEDFHFEFNKAIADETNTPEAEGVKLYPVEGIKIGVVGSRHFAITQKNPKAKVLNAALNLGLTQLKRNNTVRRALIEQGTINGRLEEWVTMIPREDVVLGISQ